MYPSYPPPEFTEQQLENEIEFLKYPPITISPFARTSIDSTSLHPDPPWQVGQSHNHIVRLLP